MRMGFNGLCFNTLRPRQNGRHFADDILKCIFVNENVWIPIKIPLKCILKSPVNNIQALVQIMAWRRPDDKPLSEPMMVRFPTHICFRCTKMFVYINATSCTWVPLYHRHCFLVADVINMCRITFVMALYKCKYIMYIKQTTLSTSAVDYDIPNCYARDEQPFHCWYHSTHHHLNVNKDEYMMPSLLTEIG